MNRTVQLARLAAPFTAGRLEIRTGKRVDCYALREWPLPGDTCRRFRLTKPGGESYWVTADLCDCTGFLQWGRCKHVTAVNYLTEQGEL